MTKIGITATLLCFLLSTMASAGDSYLCVGHLATGFKYDKAQNEWLIAQFKTHKYKVIKSNREKAVWEVREVGKNYTLAECEYDFSEYGYLNCNYGYIFNMNKRNLRFSMIYSFGYYNHNIKDGEGNIITAEGAGSEPFIEIGKCSPLP